MVNVMSIGKEASMSGSQYIQTYQKLLRQKHRIDKELDKIQMSLLRNASSRKVERPSANLGKKYVERVGNKTTLVEAIHEALVPGKVMSMKDILKAMKQQKVYRTNSKKLYTMVNNKVNRDENIQHVSRGFFVYNPPKKLGRPKMIASFAEPQPKKLGRPKKVVAPIPVDAHSKRGRGRPKKVVASVEDVSPVLQTT
jgi:hypothetical protein